MIDKNTLHRGAKIFMDSGIAETPEHAMEILTGFRLVCLVGPEIEHSPTLQTALLTAVNLAHRSFLGGVFIHGVEDSTCLLASLPGGVTLAEAIVFWGGRLISGEPENAPTLVFGSPAVQSCYPQTLRVTFNGWQAAIAPLRAAFRLEERDTLTTVGIAAASLAVSEAFQHLCGNVEAMRRTVTVSLWEPHLAGGTSGSRTPEPTALWLPEKVWLLGLGHLGQAYLWTLLALPYTTPEQVTLVLQDFDQATQANLSTSLLTRACHIGCMKTRFLAETAEKRGYRAVIQERPFDACLKVGPNDPKLLLCGVDSAAVRRQLAGAGFHEIIEAGIGDADDYLDYQIHSFPAGRTPEEIWGHMERISRSDRLLSLPAYKKMLETSDNPCGLLQVADVSVGVPFVGTYVASLVIAEAIRAGLMESRTEIVDGSLRTPNHRAVLPRSSALRGQSIGILPGMQKQNSLDWCTD